MLLGFMAKDQFGETYHMPNVRHPRKALLDLFDRKHAEKMYVDTKTGQTKHVGYIIAGHWLSVYEVHEFEGR